MEPFPEGLLRDQHPQLRHQVLVAAKVQLRLTLPLQGLKAQLFQPGHLVAPQGVRGDVGQRCAPPEVQCLPESGLRLLPRSAAHGGAACLEQLREAQQVQLAVVDVDLVAGIASLNSLAHRRPENLAQTLDVIAQCHPGAIGRDIAPHGLGELIEGHRLIRVYQQGTEHYPLLGGRDGDPRIPVPHVERPQHPQPHARLPFQRTAGWGFSLRRKCSGIA